MWLTVCVHHCQAPFRLLTFRMCILAALESLPSRQISRSGAALCFGGVVGPGTTAGRAKTSCRYLWAAGARRTLPWTDPSFRSRRCTHNVVSSGGALHCQRLGLDAVNPRARASPPLLEVQTASTVCIIMSDGLHDWPDVPGGCSQCGSRRDPPAEQVVLSTEWGHLYAYLKPQQPASLS